MGIAESNKSERGVFDCPETIHGIAPDTEVVGHVHYKQKVSKNIGGVWATIEFGLSCPCATTHFNRAQEWVRKAVDITIDEEYEGMCREECEEEEAEGNDKEWR